MKMPDGGLASVARLDMLVKPLGRLGKRGYLMGLALPDTNHRDEQENEGCEFEHRSADGAARQHADHTEDRLRYQKCDVESDAL